MSNESPLSNWKRCVLGALTLFIAILIMMASLQVVAAGHALAVMSRSGDVAWSESQFGVTP